MSTIKSKKAKSPTGQPSKINPAMQEFDAGKKVAGKRPVATPKKRKKVKGRSTAEKMDMGLPLR